MRRRGLAFAGPTLITAIASLVAVIVVSALMLPFRHHLAVATSGLILVLPVLLGAATGGMVGGLTAVFAGFVAYDVLFIPPFGRLSVGAVQNWVALGVYGVVMLAVTRIVADLGVTRAEAARRERHATELLELSDVLIGDRSLPELLEVVVATLQRALSLRSAALLMPPHAEPFATPPELDHRGESDRLSVVALAGDPLSEDELRLVVPSAGFARPIDGSAAGVTDLIWLNLAAAGRPIGVLAIAGSLPSVEDRQLLRIYANHAALALERARLREMAVRSQVAEEADHWRQSLLSAVSHDLRTPLATIKAALSELRSDDVALTAELERELLELAERQADRLERLVANLLDMTQIQGGTIRLQRRPAMVEDLVTEAIGVLGPEWTGRVALSIPMTLPVVDIDHLLVVQILVNLLDNAARHAPTEAPITIAAVARTTYVEVAVEDRGPGVPEAERERIFVMFNRVLGSGRAGLGLTIAKSFVEANGGTIRAEERNGGGARFVFTLPIAHPPGEI